MQQLFAKTHLVPGNVSHKRKQQLGMQKSEGSPQKTPLCERVIDEHSSGSSSCSITLHGEERNKRVVDPVIHIQRLHYDDWSPDLH